MRIEDIRALGYTKIYDLAIINLTGRNRIFNVKNSYVHDFVWNITPEGHSFWALINRGNFELAKQMKPELFIEDCKNQKEIYNELWK